MENEIDRAIQQVASSLQAGIDRLNNPNLTREEKVKTMEIMSLIAERNSARIDNMMAHAIEVTHHN